MRVTNTYDAYLRHETMRVVVPYLVVGMVALIWAVMIARTKFPVIAREHENGQQDQGSFKELLRYPNFLFAIVAQFLYVGAQVGTWSYFIQYVQDSTHEPEKMAGYFLTGTLVAFGVGRFSSAALMRYVKPSSLMGAYSLVNIALVAVGVALPAGWTMGDFHHQLFYVGHVSHDLRPGHRGTGSEHQDRWITDRDGDCRGRCVDAADGLDFSERSTVSRMPTWSRFFVTAGSHCTRLWGPPEAERGIGMNTSKAIFLVVTALVMMSGVVAVAQQPAADWQTRLGQILPLMGHRNWIMIVDSAYPLQSSSGVETIETNADQVEVIHTVLKAIDGSIHVRPIVYMDAELPFVPEKDAPGVTAYREGIKTLFKGRTITSLPHEQIIGKVDEVGKTFHIVVLKTNMTVPYTSVFLQLNCKYWSDEAEAQLRKAMSAK